MFNWICPTCGRDCLPSDSECRYCADRAKSTAALPAEAPSQAALGVSAPVQVPQPPAPQVPRHPRQVAHNTGGMPGWLTSLLVAGVLLGGGFAAYKYLLPSARGQAASTSALQDPSTAPAAATGTHPLARYVELTGFRFSEDARKRSQVRALLVNHSGAEIADLGIDVALTTTSARPGSDPVCTFSVKLASLAPFEAREITTLVKSHLRAYELPDWQFLRANFTITSPPAPK
jgi:hypothetical protein